MAEEITGAVYCANHPGRETRLRCNRCDKPICYQCAVRTPVGYRCRECVRNQQAVFYNANRWDLPIGAAVALTLGALLGAAAYAFLGAFGLFRFIFVLFLGPAGGGLIAEAVRRAVQRRRSRHLRLAAAVACVLGVFGGGLLLIAVPALAAGLSPMRVLAGLPVLFVRLDVLLLAGLAASAIYARLL